MKIAAALVLAVLAGCAADPSSSDERIYLEVRNRTDRTISGVLIAPPFIVGQPVTLAPGEVREWWVLRDWFPKKLIFVVEKSDERR